MCKLYAIQKEMTRKEAHKIVHEKIRIIKKTESDGLGIAVNVDGRTLTWQCGSDLLDAIGSNVLSLLDDEERMTTITIHGRTSTSSNTTVEHSHPRVTDEGPLMHNGVVKPIVEDGWIQKYDLDTDYLAELANRGELEKADEYLNGYAAILLVKPDGTLVVQNQGARLFLNLKPREIEFGTTTELAPMGNLFEDMRAEVYQGTIWVKPIGSMGGRDWLKSQYSSRTDRGATSDQKKLKPTETSGQAPVGGTDSTALATSTEATSREINGAITAEIQRPDFGARSRIAQKKRNRKGSNRFSSLSENSWRDAGSYKRVGEKSFVENTQGKLIPIDEFLRAAEAQDEMETLRALRDAQRDSRSA